MAEHVAQDPFSPVVDVQFPPAKLWMAMSRTVGRSYDGGGESCLEKDSVGHPGYPHTFRYTDTATLFTDAFPDFDFPGKARVHKLVEDEDVNTGETISTWLTQRLPIESVFGRGEMSQGFGTWAVVVGLTSSEELGSDPAGPFADSVTQVRGADDAGAGIIDPFTDELMTIPDSRFENHGWSHGSAEMDLMGRVITGEFGCVDTGVGTASVAYHVGDGATVLFTWSLPTPNQDIDEELPDGSVIRWSLVAQATKHPPAPGIESHAPWYLYKGRYVKGPDEQE